MNATNYKTRIVKSVHHRYPHIPVWRLEDHGILRGYLQKANNEQGYILRLADKLNKEDEDYYTMLLMDDLQNRLAQL